MHFVLAGLKNVPESTPAAAWWFRTMPVAQECPEERSDRRDTGIWQRWTTYAATLHGGNVGLKALVAEKAAEYCRTNMQFALLEYWSTRSGRISLPPSDS